MKVKYILVAILVAVLALGGMGCNKVTGGGSFNDSQAGKITFGFNAQPLGDQSDWYITPFPPEPPEEFVDAKGQFQMVIHGSKTKIHGTFEGTYAYMQPDSDAQFYGTCLIDGVPTDFTVRVVDDDKAGLGTGDLISIFIGTKDPSIFDTPTYSGILQGGNIKVHEAKKK